MAERSISTQGNSRYLLSEEGTNPLVFIGLMPNTLAKDHDDVFTTKVKEIVQKNSYDGWLIINVCPVLTPRTGLLPETLAKEEITTNLHNVKIELEKGIYKDICSAWGNSIEERPYLKECLEKVLTCFPIEDFNFLKLGELTRNGHPRHPFHDGASTTDLTPFDVDSYHHKIKEFGIRLSIEYPHVEFHSHLILPFNERIIFSAPFGCGKTYFLKEFFEGTKAYDVIHLFPVNYSVADNKDIFELIKYDILFELLKKDLKFEFSEIAKTLSASFFAINNWQSLLHPFVRLIPKIGKDVHAIIKDLQEVAKEFEKYHKAPQVDEKSEVITFLEAFTESKGSIFEENFYTQLIVKFVDQLKVKDKKGKKKETVLILDDLDRIDPEHVFRILNVLSAHFDEREGSEMKNKFGFDKVILVFDKQNVRQIFHNKYGSDVDYSGYLDKFYSIKIFDFDNSEAIQSQIWDLIKNIEHDNEGDKFFDLHAKENVLPKSIAYILIALVKANKLSYRRFKKIFNLKFKRNNYAPNLGVSHHVNGKELEVLFIFEFLLQFYENLDDLISAFQECKEFYWETFDDDSTGFGLIGFLLVVLDSNQHRLVANLNDVFYQYQTEDLLINYRLVPSGLHGNSLFCQINDIKSTGRLQVPTEYKYFDLLIETAKKMKALNTLKLNKHDW